jgi:hypothetical protein
LSADCAAAIESWTGVDRVPYADDRGRVLALGTDGGLLAWDLPVPAV